MALNTCNGCHQAETGTVFLHVSNRQTGSPSILSGFLTGITTSDPISGVPRSFNDLDLRAAFLKRLVTHRSRKGRAHRPHHRRRSEKRGHRG